jgi:hypothetical protein
MQNNPAKIKAIGALELRDLARTSTNVAILRAIECAIYAGKGAWFEIDDRDAAAIGDAAAKRMAG